ncbi:MAG: hypothetical protein ACLGGX_00070 [Bdellovibrionia bacterium]
MKTYSENIKDSFKICREHSRLTLSVAVLFLASILFLKSFSLLGGFLTALFCVLSLSFLSSVNLSQDIGIISFLKGLKLQLDFTRVTLALVTTPAFIFMDSAGDIYLSKIAGAIPSLLAHFSIVWFAVFVLVITYSPVGIGTYPLSSIKDFEFALKQGAKHWRSLLTYSLLYTVLVIMGLLPFGLGLILVLPLLLFSLSRAYKGFRTAF